MRRLGGRKQENIQIENEADMNAELSAMSLKGKAEAFRYNTDVILTLNRIF